jgi:DDB1- and CUL4-associated factor 4
MSLRNVHDIWSSHLLGSSLLLGDLRQLSLSFGVLIMTIIRTGADKKAVYFQDIDLSSFQTLDTHSDIFAVSQQNVCLLVHFPCLYIY